MNEITGNVAFFTLGFIGIFLLIGIAVSIARRSASLLVGVLGLTFLGLIAVGNATDFFNAASNGTQPSTGAEVAEGGG